ncbi:hypothetical protein HK101_005746, partial [Irineochytrium annulatum]
MDEADTTAIVEPSPPTPPPPASMSSVDADDVPEPERASDASDAAVEGVAVASEAERNAEATRLHSPLTMRTRVSPEALPPEDEGEGLNIPVELDASAKEPEGPTTRSDVQLDAGLSVDNVEDAAVDLKGPSPEEREGKAAWDGVIANLPPLPASRNSSSAGSESNNDGTDEQRSGLGSAASSSTATRDNIDLVDTGSGDEDNGEAADVKAEVEIVDVIANDVLEDVDDADVEADGDVDIEPLPTDVADDEVELPTDEALRQEASPATDRATTASEPPEISISPEATATPDEIAEAASKRGSLTTSAIAVAPPRVELVAPSPRPWSVETFFPQPTDAPYNTAASSARQQLRGSKVKTRSKTKIADPGSGSLAASPSSSAHDIYAAAAQPELRSHGGSKSRLVDVNGLSLFQPAWDQDRPPDDDEHVLRLKIRDRA